MLQLVEEVLAVLSAPELTKSQTTDNRDQHKADAKVLQSNVLGFTNTHLWVRTYRRHVFTASYTLQCSVTARGLL